ncbi:hypothetical protein LWI29_036984 [Acer saccharum]|uniref:Cupin type-1 domain-containing protein n=1 Tax=Acer saccharum TaxID=4024 RepID=A0AA39W8D5_ACESA|nr:hypothetical protein LWI29_036984 [Acer saccharum]
MRSNYLLSLITLLLALLVVCHGVVPATARRQLEEEEGEWDWGRRSEDDDEKKGRSSGPQDKELFLLQRSKQIVRTEAGEMRVVRSVGGGRIVDRPMHIGFITMEPQTLYVPQYIDSSLILFIRRGEARIGSIYRDDLLEKKLKTGDIYHVSAGSTFYLENTRERQRLHIVCSIDPSESLGIGSFQSFFIGGGTHPASILEGFNRETLANAFNVTKSEVGEILNKQRGGPIVFASDSHSPSLWAKFSQLKEQDRLQQLKRMAGFQRKPEAEEDEQEQEQEEITWSWRKLLNSVFGTRIEKSGRGRASIESPDSYNIYDRSPDFQNNYGWSVALDESDYSPLKHSGIGVYLVNLTAGSMMAPHLNPTATEYGIVLRGSGRIQIVYPNGTSAMNTKVKQGDVFWVPKYFAFCQMSSRTSPLEFFGFTTSARKNRPQFLVGANSILRTLPNPELAAAFNVSEHRLKRFTEAQSEAVILPMAEETAPPMTTEEKKVLKFDLKLVRVPKVIKRIGH